jgi:hypothetical protein
MFPKPPVERSGGDREKEGEVAGSTGRQRQWVGAGGKAWRYPEVEPKATGCEAERSQG